MEKITEIDPEELKTIKFSQALASKVIGGIVGGVTSLITANPILGTTVGASLAHSLEHIGKEVIDARLSPRQQVRVGRAIAIAYGKLREHEAEGRLVRSDGFFTARVSERAPGDEVTEATLQAAMSSAEEKKVDFLASLLANIAVTDSISAQTAHLLINQAQQLTYRSFILLRIAQTIGRFSLEPRPVVDSSLPDLPANLEGLQTELYSLIQASLLVMRETPETTDTVAALNPSDCDPAYIQLTTTGRLLADALELAAMEEGDEFGVVVSDLRELSQSAHSAMVFDGGSV